MGEAKARSRKREEVVKHEPRCIYCPVTLTPSLTTWEHMPPKQMFRANDRPGGMEFACCEACNNGTRAADTVASFIARMNPNGEVSGWEFQELYAKTRLIRMHAPGVLEEIFDRSFSRDEWLRNSAGILKPMRTAQIEGPLLRAYLSVFASKVGKALFRQHAGKALPLDGVVFSQWFLNAGLPRQAAETMMNMLPMFGTLKQGEKMGVKGTGPQFGYRFNSDDSNIVAALTAFHSGLYTFTIATSLPEVIDFVTGPQMARFGTEAIVKPGGLSALMPKPIKRALTPT